MVYDHSENPSYDPSKLNIIDLANSITIPLPIKIDNTVEHITEDNRILYWLAGDTISRFDLNLGLKDIIYKDGKWPVETSAVLKHCSDKIL